MYAHCARIVRVEIACDQVCELSHPLHSQVSYVCVLCFYVGVGAEFVSQGPCPERCMYVCVYVCMYVCRYWQVYYV